MAGNEDQERRSLLARLLRRRSKDDAGPEPPLLNQLSAGDLTRLGADRLGPSIHLSAGGAAGAVLQRPRGGVRRSIVRRGLPLAFLGFGGLMVASMGFGTVDALTDEGGPSRSDILRLAVMAIISLAVLGQALAVFRSLPGGRWLAAGTGRAWRRLTAPIRPTSAAEIASAGGPPLLAQVGTVQLLSSAPPELGRGRPFRAAARKGGRIAGTGGWFVLLLAVIALVALSVMGLATSVVLSLAYGGGLGIALGMQVAFLAMVGSALVFLGLTALRSMSETRLRRPTRLLRRLFRYLMRWFDRGSSAAGEASGIATGGGSIPLRVAVTVLATASVAGLGFAPSLIEGGDDGPTVFVPGSPAPEPPVAGDTATPEPTEDGGVGTPTATPAGKTPTPTPMATPVGQTPSPTPTPTPVGQPTTPTPVGQPTTPTPVGQPTTPTLTPTPTPTPTSTATPPPPPPTGPGDIFGQLAGGGSFCAPIGGCIDVSLCPTSAADDTVPPCRRTNVNSSGSFSFLDVAPGDYTIMVDNCSGPKFCVIGSWTCEDVHLEPAQQLFVTLRDGANETAGPLGEICL